MLKPIYRTHTAVNSNRCGFIVNLEIMEIKLFFPNSTIITLHTTIMLLGIVFIASLVSSLNSKYQVPTESFWTVANYTNDSAGFRFFYQPFSSSA